MTAFGTIQQAVDAIQLGAIDYLVKPFQPEVLVSKISQFLPTILNDTKTGFVAVDTNTLAVKQLANRVADSDATLMITGESGTGKEVIAQYIHQQSSRREKPFIAINCAAIPENMLEAMLFGYQKGAYTGAYKSCPGKFEQAQDGTLLLDEISEMSLPLQAKLLRVLQEKTVERLGDQNTIDLNVRVIATSNRDMRSEVDADNFREDLYYRLNVFPINMPSLRDRKDDIIPIAEYLLARTTSDSNLALPKIDNDAINALLNHLWPGNVRELDNVMQRALILQNENVITANEIHFENTNNDNQNKAKAEQQFYIGNNYAPADSSLGDDLKEHENNMIIQVLKENMGSRKTAAEKLGISPRTLRYKLARMREAGISIPA
ncbi:MAG: sigma-54 dependent transcriptional regulator [Pseudomonadota bacterium]